MRFIELDSVEWKKVSDFYAALLVALGSPKWHGTGINAMIDSMIWGGINAVEPPYCVRILGSGRLPADVHQEISELKKAIARSRREYRARHRKYVDVYMELRP